MDEGAGRALASAHARQRAVRAHQLARLIGHQPQHFGACGGGVDRQRGQVKLAQVALGALALGDVGVGADPLAHLAVRLEHRRAAHLPVAEAAAHPAHALLEAERLAPRHRLPPAARAMRPVLGVHQLERLVRQLLDRHAGHRAPARPPVEQAPLAVGAPHHLRAGLHQAAVARLQLGQRQLGRAPVGYVRSPSRCSRRTRRARRSLARRSLSSQR